MAATITNRVTLIRGENYTMRHPLSTPQNPRESIKFEHGKPRFIDEKVIVDALEQQFNSSVDTDGETFEKPVFRIERNVRADQTDEPTGPRRTRLSADRNVKLKPIRRNG